jgi:hypothetical protein
MSETDDQARLTRGLAELSQLVPGDEPLDTVMQQIMSVVVATVEAVDGASVTCRVDGRDRLETVAATSDVAVALDVVQYRTEEGPCVAAVRTGSPADALIATEHVRWPAFAAAAAERGVVGVHSRPMRAGRDVLGALNLYSIEVGSSDEFGETAVELFLAHATANLTNALRLARAREAERQLREALESRDLIGQAKGILMARGGLSADAAFDVLRRASQRTNRKLRDVARDLVDEATSQEDTQ